MSSPADLTAVGRPAPPVWTNVVDVRDAADLHIRTMTEPHAAGQRYFAFPGEPISLYQIAGMTGSRDLPSDRQGDRAVMRPRSAQVLEVPPLAV